VFRRLEPVEQRGKQERKREAGIASAASAPRIEVVVSPFGLDRGTNRLPALGVRVEQQA